MKCTTMWAHFQVEFGLEDAPVTAVSFSQGLEFVPNRCVVTLDLSNPALPVSKRIYLMGHQVEQDGTVGLARAEGRYELGDDGHVWPDPPDYVRELFAAALEFTATPDWVR